MYQKLQVLENRTVIEGVMRLRVQASEMAAQTQPGQFYMLKAWEGNVPFLMRPISVNSADQNAGTITFLYKVVGEGTKLLAALQTGDALWALGPLGHGFPVPEGAKRVAVIGRGIGIAPTRYLIETCIRRGVEVYAYLSGKREEEIFDRAYFESLGAHVTASTARDTRVTNALEEDCRTLSFDAAYSCGSKRLGAHMRDLHRQYGFPAYISLEERMGCGIGACKGCVCRVNTEDGSEEYSLVCKCGPVYPVEKVL